MIEKSTARQEVYTLDLNFQDLPGIIASFLIQHTHGAVLIECGPGSTVDVLKSQLKAHGYRPSDVTDVLVTHIHLDHAGSAGWWARQGARIHVHPAGVAHMENPEKLLESARRIYGDQMDSLWGEFLPVPAENLMTHRDQEIILIDDLQIKAVETPGHANHHFAYIVNNICFTGDVGGIRVGDLRHLRLPVPPPELNLELWRASVQKMVSEYKAGAFNKIAPTHFGIFPDPEWHLKELEKLVDELDEWITGVMPTEPSVPELNAMFLDWTRWRSEQAGLRPAEIEAFEAANPSWMSAAGIQRYWKKYHKTI